MNLTNIIAILYQISFIVAMGISLYSASEFIKKHKRTMNQKCDSPIRNEILPAQYFVNVYVVKQGNKKHKKINKEQK